MRKNYKSKSTLERHLITNIPMLLKKIFVVSVLLLLAISLQVSAETNSNLLFPQMPGVEISTYQHALQEKGWAETLDMIKAAGFTEIELDLNRLEVPIEDFRKMLDERGLKMPSIIVDYDPVVKDPKDIARKAKILGASYIVVPLIPHKQNQFGIEEAKKAVKDFNRVGRVLSKQGLIFCYHPHGYEFTPYGKGTLFDYMVQYTNPRHVSFEMDVFWVAYPGQDPVKLLNKYGNRWKLMHLKDLRKGVKGDLSGQTAEENNVALGSGQVDFPAVLRAAQRAGMERYFIEDESPDAVAHVPQSLAYLKSLSK